MPKFSKISKARLATCHHDLQLICNELIKTYDFSVREGHRGKEAQNAAYASGASKVRWPNSKHNSLPSRAVDLYPWPFPGWDKKSMPSWIKQRKLVLDCAKKLGIPLYIISWDYPHFQLDPVGKKKKSLVKPKEKKAKKKVE